MRLPFFGSRVRFRVRSLIGARSASLWTRIVAGRRGPGGQKRSRKWAEMIANAPSGDVPDVGGSPDRRLRATRKPGYHLRSATWANGGPQGAGVGTTPPGCRSGQFFDGAGTISTTTSFHLPKMNTCPAKTVRQGSGVWVMRISLPFSFSFSPTALNS